MARKITDNSQGVVAPRSLLMGDQRFPVPKAPGLTPVFSPGENNSRIQTLLYQYFNAALAAGTSISTQIQIIKFAQNAYLRRVTMGGYCLTTPNYRNFDMQLSFTATGATLGGQPFAAGVLGADISQPGVLGAFAILKEKDCGTLNWKIEKDASLFIPANTPITLTWLFLGNFLLNDALRAHLQITFELE